MEAASQVRVGGPYFEDLERGAVFDAPGLTISWGHVAIHQAICGDRLLLPLDAQLSAEVTRRDDVLIHPNLVCDVAIGQSTEPTQRVVGNLFYRGLVLDRPVFRGDTLRTRTEIVALKQNRRRDGVPPTGLAVLRIRTSNQHGESVLDFHRCPMIPLGDPEAETGHADSFDAIPSELDPDRVLAAIPADWDYGALRERAKAALIPEPGTVLEMEGRDTVTTAPELARMTLNLAMTHRDPGAGARGRRLVYGGQTISIAAAHTARALPGLATIVAWRSCEHSAPVFEGDVLATEVTVASVTSLEVADASLVELRAVVHADRGSGEEPDQVLDWTFLGVMV
jgi:2-methylfumaryl-CoA hydratase